LTSLLVQPAQAIWDRSESVEWWTNISDVIAVADVESTAQIDPLNEYWQSQEVRCSTTATLKGERIDSFAFRHDYRGKEQGTKTFDASLRPKTKLLLFYVRESDDEAGEVAFWVNLTRPDVTMAPHAPYNNDCKRLDDGEAIVALVKARIAMENPRDKSKKRGVIVPYAAANPGDMYWDFVRTADSDYKPVLVKELCRGNPESAIYNLVSYPGQETRDLIRPFLKDATAHDIDVDDGRDTAGRARRKKLKCYPLRQAAYLALVLLGESPEKPEGYIPDESFLLFDLGFENRAYFPHGDWKRLEK
jgi:hypothetical protein